MADSVLRVKSALGFVRLTDVAGSSDGRISERGQALGATLVALLSIGAIFALHPTLGVGDADGFAYLIGARSMRAGLGYVDLIGNPLNHWPPGYSLLLSLFPDDIAAAKLINYCSFGIATGLLYFLLTKAGWSWQSALGLSLTASSGFMRLLAKDAHADILTYAAFFVAICLVVQFPQRRLAPTVLWAALIPVKLIAVAFLPSAIAADILSRRDWRKMLREYWPGAIANSLALISIVLFNMLTIHAAISPSLHNSSAVSLSENLRTFLYSIPREFLFGWHGSISSRFPFTAFLICSFLALLCACSLRVRAEGSWFLWYGVAFLACAAVLLFVRSYTPSARLVGYGLFSLLLGARPAKWASYIWLLYGAASLLVAIMNATTVNSMGSLDPRYANLAAQVRASISDDKLIATNSFHILDLNANIASVPIEDYSTISKYQYFLWVTLPRYDPIATAVTTIGPPGADWCVEAKFDGGILYQRCDEYPAQ